MLCCWIWVCSPLKQEPCCALTDNPYCVAAAGCAVHCGRNLADSANHAHQLRAGWAALCGPALCDDGGADDGQLLRNEHHARVHARHVQTESKLLLPRLGVCHAYNPTAHPILFHDGLPAQLHHILGCGLRLKPWQVSSLSAVFHLSAACARAVYAV